MTAQEVLAKVVQAGGRVVPDSDRPRLLVPSTLRPVVEAHRQGLRSLVTEVARLVILPLDRFAQEGQPLEVRVPGLLVTLWFVPTEADGEAMAREGVSRGRIWTARELLDVLSIPGLTAEQVRTIGQVKVELDGDVVGVRPRQSHGL